MRGIAWLQVMPRLSSELILEAFDRRLESLQRRIDGLKGLVDRVEVVSAEVRAGQKDPSKRGTISRSTGPGRLWKRRKAATTSAFENSFRRLGTQALKTRFEKYARDFLGSAGGECPDPRSRLRPRRVSSSTQEGRPRWSRCREQCVGGGSVPARAVSGRGRRRSHPIPEGRLPERVQWEVFSPRKWPSTCPRPFCRRCSSEAHRVLMKRGGLLIHRDGESAKRHRIPRGLQPRSDPSEAASSGDTVFPRRGRRDSPTCGSRCCLRSNPSPQLRTDRRLVGHVPPNVVEAFNENVDRLNALLYGSLEYALSRPSIGAARGTEFLR